MARTNFGPGKVARAPGLGRAFQVSYTLYRPITTRPTYRVQRATHVYAWSTRRQTKAETLTRDFGKSKPLCTRSRPLKILLFAVCTYEVGRYAIIRGLGKGKRGKSKREGSTCFSGIQIHAFSGSEHRLLCTTDNKETNILQLLVAPGANCLLERCVANTKDTFAKNNSCFSERRSKLLVTFAPSGTNTPWCGRTSLTLTASTPCTPARNVGMEISSC